MLKHQEAEKIDEINEIYQHSLLITKKKLSIKHNRMR